MTRPSSKSPNILWIMTDEQRCDSMGCYGSHWANTPNLDKLAESGSVFDAALTPSPVCMPARTSLLTGQYPSQTGVWHNQDDMQTASEHLMGCFENANYQAASFGKSHYAAFPRAGRAFEREEASTLSDHVGYFGYRDDYDESEYDVVKYPKDGFNWVLGGRFPGSAEETAEAKAVTSSLEWLDEKEAEKPFFLRVSFNGPHTPVVPPAPYDSLISQEAIKLPSACDSLPENCPVWIKDWLAQCESAESLDRGQVARMRQCYYGEVAYIDSLVGELMSGLETRGLLEDTIVVFVSDHGAHLADYGLVQKQTFFEPVVRVPFIFSCPGRIEGGLRQSIPVGIHSLLPTLLDLASIPIDPEGRAPSLAESLSTGRAPEERPIFSSLHLGSFEPYLEHRERLVMVREREWKLSVRLDPSPTDFFLCNMEKDPFERNNLSQDPDFLGTRDRLLGLVLKYADGTAF